MTRKDTDRLSDVLVAAKKCQSYLSHLGGPHDEMAYDAIVRNLELVGEAAGKLSPTLRETRPEVSWSKVIGLRNVLIHQYFSADRQLVQAIVEGRLPELIRVVTDMLRSGPENVR